MMLRIRQATVADSTLLSELGYRIYPAHFQHLWVSGAEMKDFLAAEYAPSVLQQSLTESPVSWFVAETDRPVGFMKATWEATIPETDKQGVLLNKLYLDPAETGKNYGQVMFNTIIDLARNRGKNYLWLEVLEQNAGAYRFYQKQGMLCLKNVLFETASQQSILRIMGMSL
ncbi:GNAT family N-acetyltransferase [Enterobacter sichuanensis]|uniref:GNAT family N-acetyltransferase n=1 Tax=Enterobacter TaxID=547 RepID=UPI000472E775|nr:MULTISPECIES: GNAT family N-acetyltransferase [Enterobacter]MCU6425775.1 GNAT family N-acetyltransferase [Enterobacter sichuanensis]MCX4181943.1 GNAT family N-acetyltransferase [Enterobacter sp. HSTU-ASh6]